MASIVVKNNGSYVAGFAAQLLIMGQKHLKVSISSSFYARLLCQYFGAKNYKAET